MLHEERSVLSKETLDMKRAIDSLREEFEAIDWYKQRADACSDKNLKKIFLHNIREEQEHAAMLISWIRSNDQHMNEMLEKYLSRKPEEIAKSSD